MIDKQYDKFYIMCDNCGAELEPADSYDEAITRLKAEDWGTRNLCGYWINTCVNCKGER